MIKPSNRQFQYELGKIFSKKKLIGKFFFLAIEHLRTDSDLCDKLCPFKGTFVSQNFVIYKRHLTITQLP